MSKDKPNFQANKAEKPEATKEPTKRPPRKELAVVWEKSTVEGERYLNIKVNLPDGREMWMKAFRNKLKKAGDFVRPEFIAYERADLKEPENA